MSPPLYEAVPGMHIHGFTALEVTEGAKHNQEPLADYLTRLRKAGQKSLPSAPPRSSTTMCVPPCPTRLTQGMAQHRIAHSVGLKQCDDHVRVD